MDSTFLPTQAGFLIECIGLVTCLALLWLGGSMRASKDELGGWPGQVAGVVSLGILGAGVWWPAQGHDKLTLGSYVALAFALGLTVLTRLVAKGSLKDNRTTSLALVAFGLTVIYVLLTRQTTGLSHLAWHDLIMVMAQASVIAGCLVGLQTTQSTMFTSTAGRSLTALLAALAISTISFARPESVEWGPLLLQLAGLGTVIALASMVLLVVRQSKTRVTQVVAAKDREAIDNDPLTRLATRRAFEQHLKRAAKQADAEKAPLALLYIDLDGFKAVNDSYGHADGDRLLIEMSTRLRKLAREGDVLARVGADEMLMLMCDDVRSATVESMANRIIEKLTAPYRLQQREVTLTCSVGIARYPKHRPLEQLIGRADAAAQAAKREGGGRHVTYAKSMDTGARERLALTSDLRAAIERGEFELYYQPKVDAASLKITAAEALIRWHHPTRGMVSPGVFIPVAEQTGLIQQIGDWAMEDACRQAAKWRDIGLRMRVAVNLSVMQLRQPNLCEQIVGLINKYRIDPGQITCEITESLAMNDTEGTRRTFEAMGKAGIHISIDDFGTGYSSLAYLRKLPAEEVKIDRSFVLDLETSDDARAVADAVIQLAHALGKKVVAEGVETPRQAAILVELGCNQLQGYLYGKPMSASELTALALRRDDAPADAQHPNAPKVGFADSIFVDADRPRGGKRLAHAH